MSRGGLHTAFLHDFGLGEMATNRSFGVMLLSISGLSTLEWKPEKSVPILASSAARFVGTECLGLIFPLQSILLLGKTTRKQPRNWLEWSRRRIFIDSRTLWETTSLHFFFRSHPQTLLTDLETGSLQKGFLFPKLPKPWPTWNLLFWVIPFFLSSSFSSCECSVFLSWLFGVYCFWS